MAEQRPQEEQVDEEEGVLVMNNLPFWWSKGAIGTGR